MKRPLVAALSALTLLASCAKDKAVNVQATRPSDALSSNAKPCADLFCQRPPGAKPAPSVTSETATATDTSVSSSTDTSTQTEPTPPAPPAPPPPPPSPKQDQQELNDTQKMAKNATLTCKNGDCDPSVGLLSIVIKDENLWNAGQCTASLVGPDILATNAHCIPPDLVTPGSICKNRLWITFAKDPAHPEYDSQIDCDRVILRHKDGGMDGADYAYLKLARPSNRPTYRITQTGFENGKSYHLHKINPGRVQGGVMGILDKVDCRSIYESAIFSAPLDALSQTSLFVDCNVIPGNSGSPILGDDGAVHGVIYAFVKKDQIRQIFDKNGSILPKVDDIADLNVGSNFACLALPGDPDGKNQSPACANQLQHLAEKRAAYDAARVKELRPEAKKLIAANDSGHADVLAFGWTLTIAENEVSGPMGQGVPECVNAAAATPFLKAQGKIQRPLFSIRATYDKYLKASAFTPLWGGFEKTPESMSLALGSDKTYQLDITDPDSGQAEFNSAMGVCGK